MGATGIQIGNPNYEPITGVLSEWENSIRRGNSSDTIEHGALFTADGEPIVGYKGEEHQVQVDDRVLNRPGAIFTHYHPNKAFGGTLSMQDLKLFAQSQLGELRAVSSQGQLYSVKAQPNIDRDGLLKWLNRTEQIVKGRPATGAKKGNSGNYGRSYRAAFKQATTPIKSGPHEGQVKLVTRNIVIDSKTGDKKTVTRTVYRAPMTRVQAARYARQYAVGMFDRMFQKGLAKYGVTYTATKGGKSSDIGRRQIDK